MNTKFGLIKAFVGIVLTAFVAMSCNYDNEENLYPTIGKDCDTTNVTYSGTIAGIVSNNCNSCHGATYMTDGDRIRLDNYDGLKANLNDVIGAINHSPMKSAMPKNTAKLNDCKLKQFEIWNNAGAPNN